MSHCLSPPNHLLRHRSSSPDPMLLLNIDNSLLPLSSPTTNEKSHLDWPSVSFLSFLFFLLFTFFFFSQIHAPILFVITLFPLSTALVFLSVSTLPTSVSSWPRNLTDLAQLGRELHAYSQSDPLSMAHVIAVMSITAVWKHAWSIPGSIIWVRLLSASLYIFSHSFLIRTF